MNPAAGRGRARTPLPRVAGRARAPSTLDLRDRRVGRRRRRGRASPRGAFDDAARRGRVRRRRHGVRSSPASPPSATACSAIVPAGSGNDFARHLDIPRDDVAAAVACSRPGRVARVDLGRADDRRRHARRGSPPSPTPASTPRPTAGRTRSTWASGTPLYVLADAAHARRRTGRDASASPSTTTCVDTDAWLVAVGEHPDATRAG